MGKWGGVEQCPACLGSVYPNNRVSVMIMKRHNDDDDDDDVDDDDDEDDDLPQQHYHVAWS